MPKFAIDMPHTVEQCSTFMDDMAKENAAILSQSFWGCMHGKHEGWSIVDAPNKDEALKMVPDSIRYEAKVTEVDQLNAQQIKQMHQA